MIEEGIVIESEKGSAKVRIVKGEGCIGCGCASNGSCMTGAGEERIVFVSNKARAKAGDRVLIEIGSDTILKSSFIAYMVPVIFLFIGGVFGGWVSGLYPDIGSIDTVASVFGIIFLGVSIVILYFLNKRPESISDFRPVIKSILH